ncbi:M23 family metallopeptidase [Microbacterium sp. Leaf203]|uniref:M23 family metallopeptidase n=1 Tax=Microbacterium sp. Leaf203 TaxID=1735677 RepID=UPI0006F615FB|nr:M23 family metallopeptidase [Microbacterium sp. Leaf203]KQM38384.1 hypothetical protein ASE56_13960 [Microbacterium sp. Leaf203]
MGYIRPVPFNRATSWATHRRRNPPSTEPGVDYFCPIGTPVAAAESGRVVDTGDSIGPATGRFVTIDLDDGRRVRYLHLSRRAVGRGERVSRGQVVGYSGATGYGEEDWSWNVAETGGAHVHMTVWATQRYNFGSNATLDPEPLMSETPGFAGTGAKPFESPTVVEEKEEPTMKMMKADNRGTALVGAGYFKSLTPDQESAWAKLIDPAVQISPDEFDQVRASSVWGDADYTSSATLSPATVDAIAQRLAQIRPS